MATIKQLNDYWTETRYRAIPLSAARKAELLGELNKSIYKGAAKYIGSMALYHEAPRRYTNRAFPDGEPYRSEHKGGRPKMTIRTIVVDDLDENGVKIGDKVVYDPSEAAKAAKLIQTKYRKYAENAFRYASAQLELHKVALKYADIRSINSYILEEMREMQEDEHNETEGLEGVEFKAFNSRQ